MKSSTRKWSERRDSNHHCKYLVLRNLPNVSEIALNARFRVWGTSERFRSFQRTNWHKRRPSSQAASCESKRIIRRDVRTHIQLLWGTQFTGCEANPGCRIGHDLSLLWQLRRLRVNFKPSECLITLFWIESYNVAEFVVWNRAISHPVLDHPFANAIPARDFRF